VLKAAKPKNNECNSSSASFKKYSTKSSEIILKFENLRGIEGVESIFLDFKDV
jgi:hypothetical protein